MKNKPIFGIALFILFSTFISQNKFTIKKFEIKKIEIENNEILEDQELIKIFSFLLNKNIIFLNSYELKKNIDKNSFIENQLSQIVGPPYLQKLMSRLYVGTCYTCHVTLQLY